MGRCPTGLTGCRGCLPTRRRSAAAYSTSAERQIPWRGEVIARANKRPMLVRADPVLSSPGQASGFVLMFTDLTQQKAAETARQSFQERIIERGRLASRFDPTADVQMQNLFASVVENAQLAALEITDGVDLADIPQMLDSVRASVGRAKRALDHLIWHANSASDGKPS